MQLPPSSRCWVHPDPPVPPDPCCLCEGSAGLSFGRIQPTGKGHLQQRGEVPTAQNWARPRAGMKKRAKHWGNPQHGYLVGHPGVPKQCSLASHGRSRDASRERSNRQRHSTPIPIAAKRGGQKGPKSCRSLGTCVGLAACSPQAARPLTFLPVGSLGAGARGPQPSLPEGGCGAAAASGAVPGIRCQCPRHGAAVPPTGSRQNTPPPSTPLPAPPGHGGRWVGDGWPLPAAPHAAAPLSRRTAAPNLKL